MSRCKSGARDKKAKAPGPASSYGSACPLLRAKQLATRANRRIDERDDLRALIGRAHVVSWPAAQHQPSLRCASDRARRAVEDRCVGGYGYGPTYQYGSSVRIIAWRLSNADRPSSAGPGSSMSVAMSKWCGHVRTDDAPGVVRAISSISPAAFDQ